MTDKLPPTYYVDNTEDTIDIKRYLSLFFSNWYWFAGALTIAFIIAYGVNRYSEKIYTVSATLLIQDDLMGGVNSTISSVIPGGDIFRSQQNLLNEMGILRSYTLNYKVMEELPEFQVVYMEVGRRGIVENRMYKTSPFRVEYTTIETQPQGIVVNIKIMSENSFRLSIDSEINKEDIEYSGDYTFGERFEKFGFDFSIEKRFPDKPVIDEEGSNNYWFCFVGNESLAVQYKDKLIVSPIEEDASLVTLSVSGPNANQEADYLNKLMDVYIRYGLENKNQTADSTIKFIEEQLSIIVDSLALSESQLELFRQSNRFIDMSTEGNYIQSRLEKFENEKISLELQHKYYEYLSHYLESKDMNATIISPTVMGITDPVLLRLVNELSDIQKQIAEVGYSLNTQQGVYTLLTGQLDKIRQELKENVSNSLGSLNMSMTEIDKRIAEVEVELSNLPSTERQLINIERNFDLNNTVYTYLLEKRSESEIARASNVSDNRIIDRAARHSTTQIRPRKNKNIMLAWFFGLALPALCLVILDNLNDKILDKKDIERRTRVPLIGYIGHNDSDNQLPVVEKPGSSLSESFRSVRTAIKYYVDENKTAVITVTSTITSEGKSFVSANLSAITAALGKKVLLVGLDLRKPKLGKIFKSNLSGMSTFLSNNSEYEEIIQKTEVENLYFVPAGAIPPNPSELIEGERMKEFIERAKKEFDYIIFDTPPVGVVTDTLLIAPYVDVNLFIVRQRYSSRNTLDLIEYFRSSGQMKNMAIVLNDIKLRGYYGYGMRYGGYAVGYSYGYNYYGKGYYGKYGYNYKGGSGYYID